MAANSNSPIQEFIWDGETVQGVLKMYDRATTEAYLRNHIGVAVIRKPSPSALVQRPDAYLVLSFRNHMGPENDREPGNEREHGNAMEPGNEREEFSHYIFSDGQAIQYDLHGSAPHTKRYTLSIPNSGGRRKTKNHKKAHKKAHKKTHKKAHKFRKTNRK